MDRARVLVVEDDGQVRDFVAEALTQWGYDVTAAGDGAEAVTLLDGRLFDVALLDISLPGKNGLEILEGIKGRDSAVEVVMMTGDPMVSTAVKALKAGAYDYLIKPLNLEELHILMSQLSERRFLRQEVGSLRARLGRELADRELVGTSPQMREVKQTIASVAPSDAPVLIEGESGTGKELVAAAIHRQSPRAKGPFVPVNCGAIPAELMESEFFGHVRGAFSGAVADALGLMRSAHGGTLFLDEIAELPLQLQAKLLRVLQEKEVRPVGSAKTHSIDARIIAATNRDLKAAVASERFRQDLYYRIDVVRIVVPPLRDRKDEIPALVTHFLRRFNERFQRHIKGLTPDALAALRAYAFPGNVRELENFIERAYALGATGEITRGHLPALAAALVPAVADPDGELPTLEDAERDLIRRALARHGNDKDKAARALGLTVRTLYRRIKKSESMSPSPPPA
jgi:DNA-binding NtrC family response regulator